MIKIELYKNGLLVSGHANAADKGKDIYCAGVSSIVQGALNWFDMKDINYEIHDGYLKLKIINGNDHNNYLLSLIEKQLWSLETKETKKYIVFNKIDKEI